MAEHTRQHDVPQMLLDMFSTDGKRTDVVVLDAGKRIRDVGVRDQCYRDYYYGKDRVMEKAFSETEGKFAATLGDLSAAHLQSISDVETIHLTDPSSKTLTSSYPMTPGIWSALGLLNFRSLCSDQ